MIVMARWKEIFPQKFAAVKKGKQNRWSASKVTRRRCSGVSIIQPDTESKAAAKREPDKIEWKIKSAPKEEEEEEKATIDTDAA